MNQHSRQVVKLTKQQKERPCSIAHKEKDQWNVTPSRPRGLYEFVEGQTEKYELK